jgi:hypothetical protein
VALDLDQLVAWGLPPASALGELRRRSHLHNPELLAALENLPAGESDKAIVKIEIAALGIGMILSEDIRTAAGACVISKGQEVTYPLLERLRNITAQEGLSGAVGVEHHSILPV